MARLTGVILAGGLGTRLHPLTKITNKHLLPVYDRPMVFYPIEAMVKAGIKDIVLVTGGNNAGEFVQLLGTGKNFGLNSLHYVYQEGEGGIAEALGLVSKVTRDSHLAVVLGDNLFEKGIGDFVKAYRKDMSGAMIALKKVHDPERFGVAEVKGKKVIAIKEKPKKPKTDLAVTGLYFYDSSVFKIIKGLKPSKRGELEITDVNNAYIRANQMKYGVVKGWWADCGTFESLFRASCLIEKIRRKH